MFSFILEVITNYNEWNSSSTSLLYIEYSVVILIDCKIVQNELEDYYLNFKVFNLK